MNANDIMTEPVITVQPDTIVQDIARLLLERRISGVPVVDGADRVTGMVSEADLMHRQGVDPKYCSGSWLDLLRGPPEYSASDYIKTYGLHAADIMSSPVMSVTEDTPVDKITRLFEQKHIKRLPIVRDERLVGIVSRSDLLTALEAKEPTDIVVDDDVIRRELSNSLKFQSWAHSPYSSFSVENGTVRFWGMVRSSSQRKAFEVAAERTRGVRNIINDLSLIKPYLFYSE